MRIREIMGLKPQGFLKYMRSKSEVTEEVSKRGWSQSIKSIGRLFAEFNMALADNVILNMETKDLWEYREYDRTPVGGWTGTNTEDEFNALKADIDKHGIKEPIWVNLERQSNGHVKVYVGEGNHRILIAKQLGIHRIPTKFTYRK